MGIELLVCSMLFLYLRT